MLGIDVNGFYAWEDYLAIETISSNMFDDDEAANDSVISALMPHLEDGLSIRAREGFSSEGVPLPQRALPQRGPWNGI